MTTFAEPTAQMLELSGFTGGEYSRRPKQALSDITGSFPGVIANGYSVCPI